MKAIDRFGDAWQQRWAEAAEFWLAVRERMPDAEADADAEHTEKNRLPAWDFTAECKESGMPGPHRWHNCRGWWRRCQR